MGICRKKAKVTIPKEVKRSDYLDYVSDVLKEDLCMGWKIGGVVHSDTEEKTVILYL